MTYSAAGRVTCFLMVVAAVGVVSVPSGLIASGFQQAGSSSAIPRLYITAPLGRT